MGVLGLRPHICPDSWKGVIWRSKRTLLFPARGKSGFYIKSVSTIVGEFPAEPSEEFNHSLLVHAPQLPMINIWSDSE